MAEHATKAPAEGPRRGATRRPPVDFARAFARAPHAWIVLYGVLLTWFIHFWPTFHAANESIRLYFTEAVVDQHTPWIDDVLRRYDVHNVDRAEFRGHTTLDKAPGLSLWAMPFYWIATRVLRLGTDFADVRWVAWLLLLTSVVPLALVAAWAVRRVARLDGDEDAAAEATLAFALGTPFVLYATLYFGHAPAAALAVSAYLAVRLDRPGLAGALVGAMVLTEAPSAVLGALLGVVLLRRTRSLGAVVRFGLGGLPFAIVLLAYNRWLFGSPFDSAYAHKATADQVGVHSQGLLGFRLPSWTTVHGLWLSTQRGVWLHAPVALLGLVGIGAGFARGKPSPARELAIDLAILGGGYALFISGFVDWQAGAAWNNRHLVPAMPFLALGLVPLLADAPAERRRAIVPLLGALVTVGAVASLLPMATFPYAPEAIAVPLADLAWPLLRAGAIAPSWLAALGAPGALVVVGAAVVAVLVAAALVAGRPGNLGRVAGALAGIVALVAVLAVAPSRTASPAKLRSYFACLVDRAPAAAELCEEADGRFDAAACTCSLPGR
jgi:hypothetical protein